MVPSSPWELVPQVLVVVGLVLTFTYRRGKAHAAHGRLRRLRRFLAACVLPRRQQPACRERLALALLVIAPKVASGDDGERANLLGQYRDAHYLNKRKNWSSTQLLVDAISVTLAAFQELWTQRIGPWMRATFPHTSEGLNWYLDVAARSVLSALMMVGAPILVASGIIANATTLMHHRDMAWALVFAVFLSVPGLVIAWQRGRYLAVYTKNATGG